MEILNRDGVFYFIEKRYSRVTGELECEKEITVNPEGLLNEKRQLAKNLEVNRSRIAEIDSILARVQII